MARQSTDAEASVRDAVLRDPEVVKAIRRAGPRALSSPEVQEQLLRKAREKLPERAGVAGALQATVLRWVNDPEVQRQASHYAGVALDYGRRAVYELIEQGPTGVRLCVFFGAAASCVNSTLVFTGLLNPLGVVAHLVNYVVAAYQIVFALTAMLFEAPPEWVGAVPGLDTYQNLLIDKARFLSEVLGRGLFYGFQGTLWLMFASWEAPENCALGLWLVLMGFLHLCVHCNVMPVDLVAKVSQLNQAPVRELSISPTAQAPRLHSQEDKHLLLLEEARGDHSPTPTVSPEHRAGPHTPRKEDPAAFVPNEERPPPVSSHPAGRGIGAASQARSHAGPDGTQCCSTM